MIENGILTSKDWKIELLDNQYYRIIGSIFNDGVHKRGEEILSDEAFFGSVWSMAVPPTVIELADEIEAWISKYGGVDGTLMSPYSSESFGGYSYTKSSGGSGTGGYGNGSAPNWREMFADRLNRWRKI